MDSRRGVESWLRAQQVVYLATSEGGQPRVRPVSLIRHGERFYVVTGAKGGVNAGKLRQIRVNPKVEYYLPLERDGSSGFIRGEGAAHIVDDPATRALIHGEVTWARDYFPSADHPDYVLLEIVHVCYLFREPGTTEIVRIEAWDANA